MKYLYIRCHMLMKKAFYKLKILFKVSNHDKGILLSIEKNLPVNMRDIHKDGSKQLLNFQESNNPQIIKTFL